MIISEITGGLGNQMFQYACGRALAERKNNKLFIDDSFYNSNDNDVGIRRSMQLDVFHLKFQIASLTLKERFLVKNNVLHRVRKKIGNYKVINEPNFSYSSILSEASNNSWLKGYWQSEEYFKEYKNIILGEFAFKKPLSSRSAEIAKQISNLNSISLHVRRTDYVNGYLPLYGSTNIDYYKCAIEFICSLNNDPVFFVFTDDLKWVKLNILPLHPSMCLIDHNQYLNNWQDMQLMSLCKHNIIANSTFSWWGAYLNNYKNKIVVRPEKWFYDNIMNNQTLNLCPQNWIVL